MSMKRQLAVTLALTLAAIGTAHAESKPKQYASVLTVHATPEGALEYEAFVKKVSAAAAKISVPQPVLAYQVTQGGQGYSYMFITYFDKWSELDEVMSPQEILFKAHGEKEGAKLMRAGRVNIASTEQAVYKLLPELSAKAKAFDPPPAYLQVLRTHVKPGMVKQWESVLGRYKAAAEATPEAPAATRRVAVEGPGFVYVTAMPYMKFAERDAWPPLQEITKKVFGDEEARSLDERRLECIDHSEAFILKLRPDLSRPGK